MMVFTETKGDPFIYPLNYIATFSTIAKETLVPTKFPETISCNNAEQMLHVLNNMCHHPEVYRYIKSRIPSVFLPQIIDEGRLAVWSLINYLVRPSRVYKLPWKKDVIKYLKKEDGLTVCYYDTEFSFPFDSRFCRTFIAFFGELSWDLILNKQPITDWEFGFAEYDLSKYLDRFETFFVAAFDYEELCSDLKNICTNVERLFNEKLFNWTESECDTILLVKILEEIDSYNC
jgi:hypothetical protein